MLHRAAVVTGEGIYNDLTDCLPASVKSAAWRGIFPGRADRGRKNPVAGFLERCIRIVDVAFKRRVRALENHQIVDPGLDDNRFARANYQTRALLAFASERGRRDPRPKMLDHVYPYLAHLRVVVEKMPNQDLRELLNGPDVVLARKRVDGVLDGVGGQNPAVVALLVTAREVAAE